MLKIVIGDRNFSSWSLRPWLTLKQAGLPFEEVRIPLHDITTKAQIMQYSPSGKVPCLIDGETLIWDSLAICEYLAEAVSTLWPSERRARAEARAISAEMHAGFPALRQELPMDVRASQPFGQPSGQAQVDISRIVGIWENCRQRFAARGPFLFGHFTIADAMYAPVAFRFATYHVDLPAAARQWVDTMLSLPAMQEWRAGAAAEAA